MSALILPFPYVRRSRFIRRHALHLASCHPVAAERYLAHQLQIQRETMARRGIPPELIKREQHSLEQAIRTELLDLTGCSGGVL
jgi:hypothetical protein